MIQIGRTIISTELFDEQFMCDLAACKGACCVEGSSGAPLEESELDLLEQVYPHVKPYMTEEGIKSIEENGFFVVDQDGDYTTPLVNDAECAYTIFDADGTAKCGIEAAYLDKKIDWHKPISCHLYPIRIKALKDFDAVNYHKWHICKPACDCGAKLQMPVFRFCKSSIIRKYGEEYYEELEAAYRLWKAESY
ncbi:MAG: DUF3109 family protein [Flavobacteriales bacterium]|nr:DUF3109 family protein [Flavobacteriales bacterium]